VLLENCLNSVYENVGNTITYEVIVVDNNSQDGTLKMLQEKFPTVQIIDNNENLGFAKANNQAMRRAQGRYFLLLNNDTFVFQDSLEKLIKFMDDDKSIGAVSPRLLNEDGKTTQYQGSSLNKKIWNSAKPVPVKFISGAAFLIRREAYEKIGGLDEKFFFYNEDLDWCLRLLKSGWKIYYYPQSIVIHYGGKSSKLIKRKTFVEGFKGGLYFCYKHHRWLSPLYVALLIFYLFIELVGTLIIILFSKNKKVNLEKLGALLEVIYLALSGKYK
jgi:GT2 family glycosyltransferase